MSSEDGTIAVLIIVLVLLCPLLISISLINYSRGYVTIHLMKEPDHGRLQSVRQVMALVVSPACVLTNITIVLHETYPKLIIFDHFILILEGIVVTGSLFGLIRSCHCYFSSLCSIEQSFELLKKIKIIFNILGVILCILWWLVYLLPVIMQNNNYMVTIAMILCWFWAIIFIILSIVSIKLRILLTNTLQSVRV